LCFSPRRGELASNRHGDHDFTTLSLHLPQNGMTYISTLMLQQVLARSALDP
jgi:TnpA family transposase